MAEKYQQAIEQITFEEQVSYQGYSNPVRSNYNRYFTIKEVSMILNLSYNTVLALMQDHKRRKSRAVVKIGKSWRICLEVFLDELAGNY